MVMAQKKLNDARHMCEALESRIQFSRFEYKDPFPNFDRSKVKGPVTFLFRVKKEHRAAIYALELCAGSRLYDVDIFLIQHDKNYIFLSTLLVF